uniref:C2H2-type domain-containing protein n=1 Tax=Terrapene triunguis TaxID=2587831 RepID=A0A674IP34_9SAUR
MGEAREIPGPERGPRSTCSDSGGGECAAGGAGKGGSSPRACSCRQGKGWGESSSLAPVPEQPACTPNSSPAVPHPRAHTPSQSFHPHTAPSTWELFSHEVVHNEERPFHCDLCEASFKRHSDIKSHRLPFKCGDCGKDFPTSNSLLLHQHQHCDDKPHVCGVCGKKFTYGHSLKVHERVHTSERPFVCMTCGKAFKQSSYLVIHERSHTGERPYKCEVCQKAFARPSLLLQHHRVHSEERPYKCSFCDKFFKDLAYLTVHEKVHTGETPYKCSVCDKGFAHPSNLLQHHTPRRGVRPRLHAAPSGCHSSWAHGGYISQCALQSLVHQGEAVHAGRSSPARPHPHTIRGTESSYVRIGCGLWVCGGLGCPGLSRCLAPGPRGPSLGTPWSSGKGRNGWLLSEGPWALGCVRDRVTPVAPQTEGEVTRSAQTFSPLLVS